MPAELRRHFEVVFKPLSKSQPVPMRQIGSEHVGKLVSVQVQLHFCLISLLVIIPAAGCSSRLLTIVHVLLYSLTCDPMKHTMLYARSLLLLEPVY